jgi:hypothetical protein
MRMDISEIQGDDMEWMDFVLNRVQWWIFTKPAMKVGIFIDDIPF